MKYPEHCPWVLCKKNGKDDYLVKDYNEEVIYHFSNKQMYFFNQLNGKRNPYDIHIAGWSEWDIRNSLRYLKIHNLTRTSMINRDFLSIRISLFKIKATLKARAIALIMNWIFMASFLPVFITGIVTCNQNIDLFDANYSNPLLIVGSVVGLVLGIIMHETGHALAGLGYGAKVFETGIYIGIGLGAYVMLDAKCVKKRLRRVQILAAGIEMNILLAGISLILLCLIPTLSSFFFGVACNNVLLALINILFINGLDGSSIINELIGTENLFCNSIEFVFDRKEREKLLSQGMIGCAKVFSCAMCFVSQLAYPALLIINILSIGAVFK